MALPKIQQPLFDCVIPTTKKKIKIRPMLVKEEKILLIAKQASDRTDYLNAVKQVVHNCIADTDVKVDQLALADIEYVFTKIRSNSIGNIVKVSYIDQEDEKQYDFDIDLNKIETTPLPETNKFEISPGIYIQLKYPPITLYTNSDNIDLKEDAAFEVTMLACLEKIFEGDKVFNCADASKDELKEFIDSIPAKGFVMIQDFFSKTPTLFHEIKYTNSKGTERKITLRALEDFFTFG